MRKWIKRLMLLVAFLLVSVLAVIYGGFRLFKGVPEWYRLAAVPAARRELLARRAFNKFADIQNAAALARQSEIGTGVSSTAPPASIVVSFSDDELNAFFEKWANFADWKANYERYVHEPVISIRENRILLAAEVNDLDAVVSVEFNPRIDSDGKLDLRLDEIVAGRLPLPDVFIRSYANRLTARLQAELPSWQEQAAIDADGAANSQLISAEMAKLFIHALARTGADPVLFLPLVERHANVPVRIIGLSASDHVLTMTVVPLDETERVALLDQVHAKE